MSLFMGLVGMATLVLIAVLFSSNRKAINVRTVVGAFAIQAGLGAFVLYVPVGRDILGGVSDAVSSVISYGQDGIDFLFGGLVSNKMFEVFGGGGFIFAFRVLPVIIFFSSLIAVLYYLGIMQWVIKLLGGGLQKVLGTSRTESLSATANIFVGQTEAPLVVRPYISKMTDSELFAVMCGGLASVAGSVLAGYASMGVKMEYLIAASFMAAPGGLLFAKLLVPETETPSYDDNSADSALDDKPANVIDAAAAGASAGMQLALNVGAMLLAFIGLIAMINGIVSGVGGWLGFGNEGLTNSYQIFAQSLGSHLDIYNSVVGMSKDVFPADLQPSELAAIDVAAMDRSAVITVFEQIRDLASQANISDVAQAATNVIDAANYELSLELILGWIFSPLAFLIGVPWSEAVVAGSFIGQKLVVNEFVAYLNFAPYLKNEVLINEMAMSEHTKAIISFALCGFANLSSVAILLGGLGSMAPNRRGTIARFGLKAVLAGSLSNLMSATIAGFFLALSGM